MEKAIMNMSIEELKQEALATMRRIDDAMQTAGEKDDQEMVEQLSDLYRWFDSFWHDKIEITPDLNNSFRMNTKEFMKIESLIMEPVEAPTLKLKVYSETKAEMPISIPYFAKIKNEVFAFRQGCIESYWLTKDYGHIKINNNIPADEMEEQIQLSITNSSKVYSHEITPMTEEEFTKFKQEVFAKLMRNEFEFATETEKMYF